MRAVDAIGKTDKRFVVTLQVEGTRAYQVRLHFPDGLALPSRLAGDDVTGLAALLRDWLESADPKVPDLVVGAAHLRRQWRQPEGGFHYTINQNMVHILVPPDCTPGGLEATVRHLILDVEYRSGMGILYDRRLAPAPTAQYLDAVVALTHTYGAALGRCRWAVLVRKDDAETFGIVRRANSRVSPSADPGAFTDQSHAVRWLRGRSRGGTTALRG